MRTQAGGVYPAVAVNPGRGGYVHLATVAPIHRPPTKNSRWGGRWYRRRAGEWLCYHTDYRRHGWPKHKPAYPSQPDCPRCIAAAVKYNIGYTLDACARCCSEIVYIDAQPVCIMCHLDGVCAAMKDGSPRPPAPVYVRELTAEEKRHFTAIAQREAVRLLTPEEYASVERRLAYHREWKRRKKASAA